jgi:hypothetical protein
MIMVVMIHMMWCLGDSNAGAGIWHRLGLCVSNGVCKSLKATNLVTLLEDHRKRRR